MRACLLVSFFLRGMPSKASGVPALAGTSLDVQPAKHQDWLLLRMLACSLFGLPGPSSVPWWPVRGSLVCAALTWAFFPCLPVIT